MEGRSGIRLTRTAKPWAMGKGFAEPDHLLLCSETSGQEPVLRARQTSAMSGCIVPAQFISHARIKASWMFISVSMENGRAFSSRMAEASSLNSSTWRR